MSLIELGIVMVVISLALVPVVQTIGGPMGASGEGTAERVNTLKIREATLANTMVERVISGDFSSFSCDGNGNPVTFNPQTDLPAAGQSVTFNPCTSQAYSTPLYYQWNIYNPNTPAVNGTTLPEKNEYYQATFNVLDQPGGNVLLTMPTYFFYNEGAFEDPDSKTGIMLAMDISGSMLESGSPIHPGAINGKFGAPFMFYRYDQAYFTGNAWGVNFDPANVPGVAPGTPRVWLNKWNNAELDLVYGQAIQNGPQPDFSDPNPGTQNNEKFPYAHPSVNDPTWGNGLLGTGDCSKPGNHPIWTSDPNLIHTFPPAARTENGGKTTHISNLCNAKSDTANWSTVLNKSISRMEATRTAALSLLLTLESRSSVVENVEMGYIPWSTDPLEDKRVDLEPAVSVPGVPGLHFVNMRDRLLWVNRADPRDPNSTLPVFSLGGTEIDKGLESARQKLMARNYSRRIIVLLTDGQPNPDSGTNSSGAFGTGGLRDYALNTIGNNAPPDQQITLFTVGLLEADAALMTDMANSTPDGQAYIANDITSLAPIFDSIAYQLQKLALLRTADRYGIDL